MNALVNHFTVFRTQRADFKDFRPSAVVHLSLGGVFLKASEEIPEASAESLEVT